MKDLALRSLVFSIVSILVLSAPVFAQDGHSDEVKINELLITFTRAYEAGDLELLKTTLSPNSSYYERLLEKARTDFASSKETKLTLAKPEIAISGDEARIVVNSSPEKGRASEVIEAVKIDDVWKISCWYRDVALTVPASEKAYAGAEPTGSSLLVSEPPQKESVAFEILEPEEEPQSTPPAEEPDADSPLNDGDSTPAASTVLNSDDQDAGLPSPEIYAYFGKQVYESQPLYWVFEVLEGDGNWDKATLYLDLQEMAPDKQDRFSNATLEREEPWGDTTEAIYEFRWTPDYKSAGSYSPLVFVAENRYHRFARKTLEIEVLPTPHTWNAKEFGSLQEAVDYADSGDMVRVALGSYEGDIVMKEGVNLLGSGRELTIIEGKVTGASNCYLEGFTVLSGVEVTDVSNMEIVLNDIRNPVTLTGSPNILIQNNLILTERDEDSGTSALTLLDSPDSEIVNNTVERIMLINSPPISLRNNIIMSNILPANHPRDYALASDTPVTISYNIIYNRVSDEITLGEGNLEVKPRFVNAPQGNYHQKSQSPGVDAGDPQDEYFYEPMPNGGRINLGCYGNTEEAAPTFLGHSYSVSGVILFADPGWKPETAEVMYQLTEPGTTNILSRGVLTLPVVNDIATFTLEDIPEGTYDLAFKHRNHLADAVEDLVVDNDIPDLNFTLIPGDTDGDDSRYRAYPDDFQGDNDFDRSDYGTFAEQYWGRLPVTPGYNGDVDGDGDVDRDDFNGFWKIYSVTSPRRTISGKKWIISP